MGKVIQAGAMPEAEVVKDIAVLYTVKDLMRIFGVSDKTARDFYLKYGLRAIDLPGGREVRFTRAAIEDFIQRHERIAS